VVVVEPDPVRREIACDLGADAAFAPGEGVERWLADRSHRLGADLVYDCAGTASSLATTVDYVRRGGAVIVAGVSPGAHFPWSPKTLERELTVRASLGYTVGDVRRVLDLMADDRLRLSPVVDPVSVALHQIDEVLTRREQQPAGWLKHMVDPRRR
jgi:threonine dehydrogenase-like Zn-dependent dehydrogenase